MFTAKAHELMTRFAIDQALLAVGNPDEQPISRRIALDDPYVDAKSYLLQVVAEHNRCGAVFDGRYAMSTVIGFRPNLDAAELLFASLLVQARVTLTGEARNAPAGAHTHGAVRSGRRSWWPMRHGSANALPRSTERCSTPSRPRPSDRPSRCSPPAAVRSTTRSTGCSDASSITPVKATWDGFGAIRGKIAGDQAQLAFADLAEANAS